MIADHPQSRNFVFVFCVYFSLIGIGKIIIPFNWIILHNVPPNSTLDIVLRSLLDAIQKNLSYNASIAVVTKKSTKDEKIMEIFGRSWKIQVIVSAASGGQIFFLVRRGCSFSSQRVAIFLGN